MTLQTLQRNTVIGFFASILLSIIKLTAGLIGHSTALIADSMESFADTLGSILVWQALRVASRPADEKHPWGYGRAEAVASLLVGVMLVVAAILITVQSIHEILIPHAAPEPWTLLVLIAVIAVKEFLFRIVIRGADAFESGAARADAWHHRSDAITSLAALLGVSLAIWGPAWLQLPSLVAADEAAAILASGVILLTAWHLIQPALHELLDATSPELEQQIRRIAENVDGVLCVEKVAVRKSGSGYHADMHLQVPPNLTIQVAHALAGKVKALLRSAIPGLTGVLIHVEPFLTPDDCARESPPTEASG